MYKKIIEDIENFLCNTEITKYRIAKDTGLTASLLWRLVKKERKVSNLRLKTAIKLGDYYKSDLPKKLLKDIEKLLKEPITNYRIAKDTETTPSLIYRLREEGKIEDMQLSIAIKLGDYYRSLKINKK